MVESQKAKDFKSDAISKMRSPFEMHIICIDITNKCDMACSNCTRLLENQDEFWEMTPENFRIAVKSLADFPGTIGVLGGNPTMHRNFEEICRIFVEEMPHKTQRGLWTNNIFKHSDIAKEVFGGFNLNPHGDARGVEALQSLRSLGIGNYYEGYSKHAPLLVAVKDLFSEEEMWARIATCDINRYWSASIVQNKGKLRAYFCEVAAAFDLARGTDHGVEVVPGWWRRHISEFADQVEHFCPGCGVPVKAKPSFDYEEIDTYTRSNADLALKSSHTKNRKIVEFDPADVDFNTDKATNYSQRWEGADNSKGKPFFVKAKNKLKQLFLAN